MGVASGTFTIPGFGKFWYGLEISAVLCHVSKSRLAGAFSVLDSRIFFARSRSLGYFCRASRNLGILSDQTRIYLKDVVFGDQNIYTHK